MTENKKQTVLVIEDNPDSMVLITLLLDNFGYRSIGAVNGEQGIQMAIERQPDFILLDIQLPDINGIEVLKRIRALDMDVAKAPIIAVTTSAMSGDREKLMAAGCDGYIEKPIDPMKVISQISTIISESL